MHGCEVWTLTLKVENMFISEKIFRNILEPTQREDEDEGTLEDPKELGEDIVSEPNII